MENSKADIIAGIRELRAKAAEQLTGNEYYMIVQQLDSLAVSAELSDEAARSVFSLISARLSSGAPVVSAAGAPEVPETPDSPAQPDAPSTPEVPSMPDSPAQPDGSPGPEIPSPPSSPAEPQTPPEASGAPVAVAGSEEPVHIITPSANSFGMPQPTVGVRYAETAASSEAPAAVSGSEAAPAVKPAGGLASAIMAARSLVEEKLSGNSYYAAANLLGQLQILPPAGGGGEATRPDSFEAALALLRREAAHLTGIAHDEASRVIAALETVLTPQPQPVPEIPAEAAAPQAAAAKPEAAQPEPEPEPEPRTGFDDLAEAAWQRVREVSAADTRPAAALNGSTAPAPAAAPAPAPQADSPAPAAAAPTEIMTQDIGEAFNDGGSESRSSEPCYLGEFELAGAQRGASERQEPAAEAAADAAPETERQAAVSAEAEALIALAATGGEVPAEVEAAITTVAATEPEALVPAEVEPVEEAVVAAAASQTMEPVEAEPLEDVIVATAESQVEAEPPLDEAVAVTAEPQTSEPEVAAPEPVVAAAEPVTPEPGETALPQGPAVAEDAPIVADTQPATAAAPVIEQPAEPACAVPAASEAAAESRPAPAGPAEQTPSAKPAKRGFFDRLFGGSGAENRR